MPLLGYWKNRGLAQPIRLLLHYVRENYDDYTYEEGDAPDYSREQWLRVKDIIGLPFPNLPFYLDGDLKITQSNAIIRYIARKHDLLGKTEEDKVAVDVLLEQAMDFRNALVKLAYSGDYEKLKDDYFKELPQTLQRFEAFLGDKSFFIGRKITAPDFVLYELLDQHRLMKEGCLTDFPKLLAFLDRIEAEPNIKAYMASDKFIRRPVNNKVAQFK
ncbi:hypothetical protein CHS0354_000149 [Potamilus streckersoni]|uniref:glutathione transferase n=1 Tax=Potamilus streckersoni TaxID=2493646 RepID=A0AAE0VKG8_9BIVA|nr:hypothetical protein CHS0354_000149 [Potamilus streckersoni]